MAIIPHQTSTGDLDRALGEAWRLPTFESDPRPLSALAEKLESTRRSVAPDLSAELRSSAVAARASSRAAGGGATISPGQLVLERNADALRILSRKVATCVLVSSTNGKTTTASMLAAILREAGLDVVHNRAGANVPAGIASALLEERGEIAVLEVDEAWLPLVAAELDPGVIVLGNLFRDRLDGYGELEAIVSAWEAMASRRRGTRLVLNADDPFTANLARFATARVTLFGIEDAAVGLGGSEHAADAAYCRLCEAPLDFETRMLSHLGHYRCAACGAARPAPHVDARRVELAGAKGASFVAEGVAPGRIRLPAPGVFNVYNALAAASAAVALGIDGSAIGRGLEAFRPAFGRGETIRIGPTDLTVTLMKNPAGANALVRMLAADRDRRLSLLIALNDGGADGRDVSWIWDADFEPLASRVGPVVCAGLRAEELALRLKYAGWPTAGMKVERSIPRALDRALASAPAGLDVLPTYSALLELYRELAERGLRRPFWA
jgi:UDP-N-acetylmuramyl tripeptide synthase